MSKGVLPRSVLPSLWADKGCKAMQSLDKVFGRIAVGGVALSFGASMINSCIYDGEYLNAMEQQSLFFCLGVSRNCANHTFLLMAVFGAQSTVEKWL
jgi:hypothetical protein